MENKGRLHIMVFQRALKDLAPLSSPYHFHWIVFFNIQKYLKFEENTKESLSVCVTLRFSFIYYNTITILVYYLKR